MISPRSLLKGLKTCVGGASKPFRANVSAERTSSAWAQRMEPVATAGSIRPM
ncbi:Uncharacterised protein [Bordetella pertussis]|nr:Uncharacterised protein [Bordetella pertussis]CFP63487.1 Uncharacterised protein [Bordetella pertussis]CFW32114.1 Uncharacterised protein [Bordetella pertussis]